MKKIFGIFVLLLLMVCNNSKGLKKDSEINFQKNESCKKLSKFDVNSEKIELKNSNLTEINCISNYKNVKELDLRWNKIKDMTPLENLKKLEVLKINFNQIENIKPLLNLTNLRELWIHNNKISDTRGIKKLTKLEHLDVSFNPLKNGVEEISRLKNLKRLELREIPKEISRTCSKKGKYDKILKLFRI